MVKIRFGNGHCGPTTDGQSAETVTAYRRKPPAQVKRDRARVAAHKRQQSAPTPRMQIEDQAGDQDSLTSDIAEARYDVDEDKIEHFLDPLAMSFEPSQVIHNTSMLSRGDDSLISLVPCSETLTTPSMICSDTQLNPVAMVTSSTPSSAVTSPQKAKHSDISSVCSHASTSSCGYDDDLSSRDTPLCNLDSILNVLRNEIRSILTDTGIDEKPD